MADVVGEDGSDDQADDLFAETRVEDAVKGTGSVEQAEDELDVQDGDCEGASARVLPDPGEPTASQMEDHRASGHIPYRSWCRECVEGRATGEQHRKRRGTRTVCVFSVDYLFLDKTGQRVERASLSAGREEVDVTILWPRAASARASSGT